MSRCVTLHSSSTDRGQTLLYCFCFLYMLMIFVFELHLFDRYIRLITSLHAVSSPMTDFGTLNLFLAFVTRNASGMFLSQQKYATKVLDRAGMLNCKPCRTPVDTNSKLSADGAPISDSTLYRSLAGALQYLTFTRPDISYAVQQVCLFMHVPPREPSLCSSRELRPIRSANLLALDLVAEASIGVLLAALLKLAGYVIYYVNFIHL
ncbi:ribonuclease H-like domain-containing protein [Tanacetum coccineum]